MALDDATTIAVRPAIPTKPLASSPQSRSETFFKAPARIDTATDMAIIAVHALDTFPVSLLILLKIAIAPSRLAKSTVIAPREADSLSLSIREIATIEPASKAIAAPILSNVPALRFVWYASKQPLTPSRIPVTPSRTPLNPSSGSVTLFKNLEIDTAIPPTAMLLRMSRTPLKSAFPSFSASVPIIVPTASAIPPAITFTAVHNASMTLRNLHFSNASPIISKATMTPLFIFPAPSPI